MASTISYTSELKTPKVKKKTLTMMMMLIIFVVVMMFAAWSSAYIVSMSGGFWVYFGIPSGFNLSTVLIILCSVGMFMSLRFAIAGKRQALVIGLLTTLVLSIGFGISQFNAWGQMVESGNHVQAGLMDLTGAYGEDHIFFYQGTELVEDGGQFYMPADVAREYPLNDELEAARNTASSYFYVLTGMHLVHVLIGMGLLIYILIGSIKGRYGKEDFLGIKLTGWYWHFMGGLWIYIMLFLQFIH